MNKTTHPDMTPGEELELDNRLRIHFAKPLEDKPSEDCIARSREAALGACDLLKMQRCRPLLPDSPASLLVYFQLLAAAAKVSLDRVARVFCTPQAPTAATGVVAATRPWLELAHLVGMNLNEVTRRLHWGYAFGDIEGRARTLLNPAGHPPEARLRAAEAAYSATEREELESLLAEARHVFSRVI